MIVRVWLFWIELKVRVWFFWVELKVRVWLFWVELKVRVWWDKDRTDKSLCILN